MSYVTVPEGSVVHTPNELEGSLEYNRRTSYTFELVDENGHPLGALDGVSGGSLAWTANSAVKGAGKIAVTPLQEIDWLHSRVKPIMHIENVGEWPLGVFIPAAPVEQWNNEGMRQEVELLDRTSVLKQDFLDETYTVTAGTNVTDAVRTLITSTGESAGAITETSETVPHDLSWGPGKNKLTVVNELLDAAGFFSLWADENGQFRVEPYDKPKNRAVVYEFRDNEASIYEPSLSIDKDIYGVPNKVIMTAQGSGQSEGWVAEATNEDPDSEFSFQNRGRWITDIQLSVEATSQANLQAKAERRLSAMTAIQAAIEVRHAPLPTVRENNVVRFRRDPADVNGKFTVTKTEINFDPTSLSKTTLTEVTDL